jgi:hypothetical protein
MKCRTSAVKRLCVWLGCLLVVCPVLSRSFSGRIAYERANEANSGVGEGKK